MGSRTPQYDTTEAMTVQLAGPKVWESLAGGGHEVRAEDPGLEMPRLHAELQSVVGAHVRVGYSRLYARSVVRASEGTHVWLWQGAWRRRRGTQGGEAQQHNTALLPQPAPCCARRPAQVQLVGAGWGTTDPSPANKTASDTLMQFSAPIVPLAACNGPASWDGALSADAQFCSGFMEGGASPCRGDSGEHGRARRGRSMQEQGRSQGAHGHWSGRTWGPRSRLQPLAQRVHVGWKHMYMRHEHMGARAHGAAGLGGVPSGPLPGAMGEERET